MLYQIHEIINNRTIKVKVNNSLSEPRELSNGAPQGLALSLPITSIYTNGLEEYLDAIENDRKRS